MKDITKKTLEILNEADKLNSNTIAILGNRIMITDKIGYELTPSQVQQFKKIMSGSKNYQILNSWIEVIKKEVKDFLRLLNEEHTIPYEDRGWTFTETATEYHVDVFLDNYDVEQFLFFMIPKNEIELEELELYAKREED